MKGSPFRAPPEAVASDEVVVGARSTPVSALAAWLPVGLWVLLILRASTGGFAAARTLVWIEWLVRNVWQDAPVETIYLVNFVARKSAHVTEYAIFVILLVRAFRSGTGQASRLPSAVALVVAALLALADEGLQALTLTRTGSLLDCVTDFCGAVLGALFVRRLAAG